MLLGTLNNTAIQLLIPDAVRGRISSFLMMSFSLPLLGSLPLSAVAESQGVSVAVGGAVCANPAAFGVTPAFVEAQVNADGTPFIQNVEAGFVRIRQY